MLKGIYSAAAGMTGQMTAMDVLADNLANVNTPGYKQSGVRFKTFGDALVNRIGNQQQRMLGEYAQGSQVWESLTNFTQGDLMQTGNPLDMAIQGAGFFVVKLPTNATETTEIAYTRAGHFTRDESGYLITPDGARVQGTNGDILIPKGAKKIEMNASGNIFADGLSVGTVKVAQFKSPHLMQRMGANLYSTEEDPERSPTKYTIESGYLERSNANVISEMVNSITGVRIYETMQKSIQMQNETLGKAVNEVGKVT